MRRTLACLAALMACSPCLAQLPGPGLPKLGNFAFGWVTMSGVDPSRELLSHYAPQMMIVKDRGYHSAGELMTSRYEFGQFKVRTNMQCGIASLGNGLFRLSHFGFNSNEAFIEGLRMPGIDTKTNGDSVELAYAQQLSPLWIVGFSVVPEDSTRISLKQNGNTLMNGSTDTDWCARFGAIYRVNSKVRTGFNYAFQRDYSRISYHPSLTGAPGWTTVEGRNLTRSFIYGATYRATPKTMFYGAHKFTHACGTRMDRIANVDLLGVQQTLQKGLAVRASYLGRAQTYSVQWDSKMGALNLTFTNAALHSACDILGDGTSWTLTYAVAF